jgi:hypothetical protein
MDDNITRALEAHPTPWQGLTSTYGVFRVEDGNGQVVMDYETSSEAAMILAVEGVNASAAHRAQAERVKALVEAARAVAAHPPSVMANEALRNALAPFEQEAADAK